MQVNKNAYEWVLSLCKYGDLYLQLFKESEFNADLFFKENNEDLTKGPENDVKVKVNEDKKALNEDIKVVAFKNTDKYIHYLEAVPNPARMFDLTRFGKTCGFIDADVNQSQNKNKLLRSTYQYNFAKKDVKIYDATKFVHAILTDNIERHPEEVNLFLDDKSMEDNTNYTSYKVKSGQSIFYNIFKIWRLLTLLENSLILNRVTKSSIIRMINVEVGDMPKEQVGPYLQRIKQLMEQKAAFDEGNSMEEYTNPGPIENNIYVPTHNGQGAITTGQVGGDVNVGEIPDIEYFQNKFFGSMRIPKQYFGLTNDSTGFNGGSSLSIISSRYAKAIKRIQNALIQALTNAINVILLDKGLDNYIGKFTIMMQPPTTQEEIDRRENTASRIGVTADIMNLLGDIENPAAKLKILKALLSNIINDDEVISLIEDEIDKLENEENNAGGEEGSGESDYGSGDLGDFDSGGDDFGMDSALGLDDSGNDFDMDSELDTGETESEESGETLPTPEELGVDLTDNNTDLEA